MRLELDKLEEQGGSFAHVYRPDELSLEDETLRLREPLEVSGRIRRSGQQVRLRGTIKTAAEVDCDRCLARLSLPVATNFDVTYVPTGEYEAAETAELNEEDLSLSVYDGEAIEMDDLVREQVLLALPTRALCRDECKGLCPVCGANRNQTACACEAKEIDPRWQALKDLNIS